MPKPIILEFACNDPNNGNDTGRCGRVRLSIGLETAAGLDCGVWPPSRFPRFICQVAEPPKSIQIGRRKFPVVSYKSWCGNWCWDAATVSAAVAADVLNYLRELGWHNEGGFCDIGDKWDRGEKFRPSDIASLAMDEEELAERKISKDRKGGDPEEWPTDLRVREFPEARRA